MILMFLLNGGPSEPPRPPPGLPPGRPPAPSPAGEREKWDLEKTRERSYLCDLHNPSLKLIRIPVNDDDDDQSPQEEVQQGRSRSRERVHPPAQASQEPQLQPMDTPDEELSDMNPSSPSAGPQPSAEQKYLSRSDERSRSRERTPPQSFPQDLDESSATVDPQGRVSDSYEKSHEEVIHHSNEEGKLLLKGNRVNHQRLRSTSLLIQMKPMKNLEMNLEPLHLPNLLDQCFRITLVMKTVNTARNTVHKVRTLEGQYPYQISMCWPMKSIGQWHQQHINMPQRLDRFAFQSLKMENNKMYAIWSPCRVCNDHCISMKRPTDMKL